MSKADKLMALEAIWKDLTADGEEFPSPPWHQKELQATERRVKAGQEQFVDWESAKKKLRRKAK